MISSAKVFLNKEKPFKKYMYLEGFLCKLRLVIIKMKKLCEIMRFLRLKSQVKSEIL